MAMNDMNHADVTTCDVVIIGAGVIGCAVARELARYRLDIIVLEKESDVGQGISARNSGVVHAGFNCEAGTVKAGLCVEGCRRFGDFCEELGVPYRKTGKLVVALDDRDREGLRRLKETGEKNGVEGLEIIETEERIRRLEPNIRGVAAMISPWTAITSPYLLTVALAENALANGVRFFLDTKVTEIRLVTPEPDAESTAIPGPVPARYRVQTMENTGSREFRTACVINCAGLHADTIAAMAGPCRHTVHPCRGEYFILDKRVSGMLSRPVYPVPRPGEGGLGVHLTTTLEGNILIGPSAEYIEEREDYATTAEVMEKLFREAQALLPQIERQDFIRDYAGVRPKLVSRETGGFGDFLMEESACAPGFFNLLGIESPGLTCAPVIGEVVARLLSARLPLVSSGRFQPKRSVRPRFRDLDDVRKAERVRQNPAEGVIVCRCEEVTLAEIREALDNPLGVRTLAGIKYRTRAMMGRCQGGYCMTRIIEEMQEHGGMSPEEIRLGGAGTELFAGYIKGAER